MDTAALVLGVIGTITGALSLGWNIALHFLTAGRAKVTLRGVWFNVAHYASVPIDIFDPETPVGLDTKPGILVEVANTGRLPVSVTEVSVGIGPTIAYGEFRPRNPSIPHRLEVGDVARWVFDLSDVLEVVELARKQGPDVSLRARASVGSGDPRFSKEMIDPSRLTTQPREP